MDELHELLANLVFGLRNLYQDREVMRATLHAAAARTKVLANWEDEYRAIRLNPPGPISERVSETFQPLIELVRSGLADEGVRELLLRVRELQGKFLAG